MNLLVWYAKTFFLFVFFVLFVCFENKKKMQSENCFMKVKVLYACVLKQDVCVCVFVFVHAWGGEGGVVGGYPCELHIDLYNVCFMCVSVCLSVCVWESEREWINGMSDNHDGALPH